MPPSPIKLTKKGNTAILVGQRPDGEFIPAQVDNDGQLLISGGGGGGGGTVDQGTAGVDPWLFEISHPIENDGGDYVRTKDKNSDDALTALVMINSTLGSPLQAGGNVAVTNFPATQPVSATSLPLPSGAATSAKQPTLGIAGTASTDVITVQGIAGGTPIPVSGSLTATVSGVATNTAQTDGTQKSIVRGGAKGSTSAADVTSTAGGSNHQLLDVAIYNSAGTMISAGDTTAMYVQGPGNAGAALLGRPNVIAISDGGNAQIPLGDSSGRQRVIIVRNLATNGTTDAATRFPTLGDFTASSSGVAVVKATGGRLFAFDVYYTGSTASGIWLHAHDAASATTPVTGTIKKSWPINNGANVQIEWDSIMDLCFTNGIKFTISSTRLTETTATTETFSIAAWGA